MYLIARDTYNNTPRINPHHGSPISQVVVTLVMSWVVITPMVRWYSPPAHVGGIHPHGGWVRGAPGPWAPSEPCFLVFVFCSPLAPSDLPGRPLTEKSKPLRPDPSEFEMVGARQDLHIPDAGRDDNRRAADRVAHRSPRLVERVALRPNRQQAVARPPLPPP